MSTEEAEESVPLGGPFGLRRALLRGGVLALVNVTLFSAIGLEAGGLTAWDLLFVALLGLVAVPLALFEHSTRERSLAGALVIALLVVLLAGVGFVMAWVQVTYSFELLRWESFEMAVQGLGREAEKLVLGSAETRSVLFAFAPVFGLVLFLRVRGLHLFAQMGISLAGAQVLSLVALIGFQGFPQVGWLHGAGWCSPGIGTFFFLLPLLMPFLLPLLDSVLDQAVARWQAAAAE